MPSRPKRYCAQPGCPVLLPGGPAFRCPPHAVALEHTRPNRDVRKRYHTAPWIRLRQQVLVEACYTCAACGRVQGDLDVDHIVKHNGDAASLLESGELPSALFQLSQPKNRIGIVRPTRVMTGGL